MNGKYVLSWIGMDIPGESYTFDTKEECLEKLEGIKSYLTEFGHKLWYASIKNPKGEIVFRDNGVPYK
jgi:hypothetical protein